MVPRRSCGHRQVVLDEILEACWNAVEMESALVRVMRNCRSSSWFKSIGETIKEDEFRIIHPVQDDFPFVHSTILYPEWPMAALKQVDDQVANKVAAALEGMPSDCQAAKRAKIVGWAPPADYTPVADCLRAIGYGSFKGE